MSARPSELSTSREDSHDRPHGDLHLELASRPPRSLPWHVARPRLEEDLLGPAPLVVVRGPAGSGKTVLTADVVRRRTAAGGCGVWVDVARRPGQDDVVAALREHGRAAGAGDVLVVLDRYDTRLDPSTDDDVLDLVERHPALHVVATCRRVTGLESVEADVRLGVQLVGPDDLALDVQTVQAMAERSGVTLDERAASRVLRVTGGVAVHVRVLLSADRRGAVRLSSATDRTLLELAARTAPEVVDLSVPAPTRAAWGALAVPDAVPRALAEALLGAADAAAALEMAERDGIGSWRTVDDVFELAPLARHVLRDALHRTDPSRERDLLGRTAAWALEHGDHVEGLRASVLQRDYATANRIVIGRWSSMVRRDSERVAELMGDVPRGDLLRNPYLALMAALCHNALPGHRARALEHLAILLAAVARRLPKAEPGEKALLLTVESVGLRLLGRGSRAAAVARRALASLEAADPGAEPDIDLVRPTLTVQLASSLFADGDVEGALTLARAVDADDRDPTQDAAVQRTRVALFAALAGRVDEARDELALLLPDEDVEVALGPYRAAAGGLARAVVALEDHCPAEATRVLRGLDAEMETNEYWAVHAAVDTTAALAAGDVDGALATVGRARDRGGRRPVPAYWQQVLGALHATALLAAGQADAAALQLRGLDRTHEAVRTATARVRLAVGDAEGALEALGSSPPSAAGPAVDVDRRLLLAVATARLEHPDVAGRELASALADPATTRVPWLLVSRSDRSLLEDLARDAGEDLLGAVRALPDLPAVVPDHVDTVRLTEREHVVLQGLAQGLDGPELAELLEVSLHTVKSQSRTLYRKLGVRSRAEALIAARRHGLLP